MLFLLIPDFGYHFFATPVCNLYSVNLPATFFHELCLYIERQRQSSSGVPFGVAGHSKGTRFSMPLEPILCNPETMPFFTINHTQSYRGSKFPRWLLSWSSIELTTPKWESRDLLDVSIQLIKRAAKQKYSESAVWSQYWEKREKKRGIEGDTVTQCST